MNIILIKIFPPEIISLSMATRSSGIWCYRATFRTLVSFRGAWKTPRNTVTHNRTIKFFVNPNDPTAHIQLIENAWRERKFFFVKCYIWMYYSNSSKLVFLSSFVFFLCFNCFVVLLMFEINIDNLKNVAQFVCQNLSEKRVIPWRQWNARKNNFQPIHTLLLKKWINIVFSSFLNELKEVKLYYRKWLFKMYYLKCII